MIENGVPFIGLNKPFVGRLLPRIIPFIGQNKPSVSIRRFSGFTLVELITTLVIAGVLVSLAAPAMTSFIKNNRLTSQANGLMADLSFARSEAVKQGVAMTVCRSSDALNCDAGAWDAGWLIVDGAGQVLRTHTALSGQNTLVADATIANTFNYLGSGLSSLGLLSQFTLCDANSGYGRIIEIAPTGRARVFEAPGGTC